MKRPLDEDNPCQTNLKIKAVSAKMAERFWGDGREAEAKALLDALDTLNRALDSIRIGKSRRVLH